MLKIGRISFAALIAAGVFMAAPLVSAQTTSGGTTQQTDQSEEDWRNSQKKPGSDDIFEDIRNNRTTGSGSVLYGPPSPLDSLPEESRRHLTRARAKALATGDPHTIGDTPYTPSESAKSDPNLEQQEKEAWEAIMSDLKGSGQGTGTGQQGTGQQGQAGSQGQSGQDGNSGQRSSSILRGGSSASVADILAAIKGRSVGEAGSGTSPQGSSPQGNSAQGAGQQGSAQEGTRQQAGTSPQDGSAQDGANSSADGSQDGANGDENASGAQGQAANDGGASDAANPPQGPLDRLKERKAEREDEVGGQRTNAYEFLRSKTSGD